MINKKHIKKYIVISDEHPIYKKGVILDENDDKINTITEVGKMLIKQLPVPEFTREDLMEFVKFVLADIPGICHGIYYQMIMLDIWLNKRNEDKNQ
jgi:hypothetical protein